jgi:LPXTG-motif cell wall-anchored protein
MTGATEAMFLLIGIAVAAMAFLIYKSREGWRDLW